MNFSLAALSLSTIIMVTPCVGFITSNREPAATTTAFRPPQDSIVEPTRAVSSDTAPQPPRVLWSNGPKAALAAAMIKELCNEYIGEEGDMEDFLDECYI